MSSTFIEWNDVVLKLKYVSKWPKIGCSVQLNRIFQNNKDGGYMRYSKREEWWNIWTLAT